MNPRIYTSNFSDAPILNTSIFTRLFSTRASGDIGGFPGSRTALIDAKTDTSLTRAQLVDLSLSFGYGIQNHPVLAPFTKRGSTVLLFSANSLAWPIVLFGCVAAGLRCTLANNAFIARELEHQYSNSGAGVVITSEDGIGTVRTMFQQLGIAQDEGDRRTVVLGRDLRWAGGPAAALNPECWGLLTLPDLLSRGKLKKEEQFEGELAHETVYLCYSSGTTGKPKGVETTHQNMTTNLDIVRPFFLEVQGNGTVLSILPWFHCYGLLVILHLPLILGWSIIIQPQFEPVQFCATIERFKIPLAFIVPPVLVILAQHSAVDEYDLSSLEYMLSAAAPLGADLVHQVKMRLLENRPAGATCSIAQAFGLTETTTGTHLLPFRDSDRKIGSVGLLCSNLEARIIHDDEGNVDAQEGAPGELWDAQGYLNNPQATANSTTPDGWFKTGDIVVRDKDSFFYVLDRKKDLIKYKGFQGLFCFISGRAFNSLSQFVVAPAELESVLLTHPDIADAAVIGMDSREQATELPRAYVVHARPQEIQGQAQMTAFAESVAEWMKTKVNRHKFLRGGR
ncbi:4-coumarate--CoA ligase-like 7 [Mycena sanguinolenta]|uniref:4-coumarate--CoA ligase-like 7 n=1 Tax=Mycena sanguinolenta TaxID=230812 RepID=A0A8H7CV50_9AGAR|nr:4-coumarate--CoA ligase-like 7 [Mycena sanguinolenta]